MKVRVHYLNYYSPFVSKEDTFVLISDIHSDIDKIIHVFNTIEDIRPSYILIPGDVRDCASDSRNNELMQFLEYQGNRFPMFISIGNHDMTDFSYNSYHVEETIVDDFSFFQNLKKSNINTFMDNNEGILIGNNTNLFGIEMSHDWYKKGESAETFYERMRLYEFNPDMLNILLFHSPYCILDKNGELFTESHMHVLPSLVVTGHTHGGLVPYGLQAYIPNNRGIIGPNNRFFPRNSYGVYNGHDSSLIISDGVTKIHDSFGGKYISPFTNNIYIPDVYVITVVPSRKSNEDKKLVRTITKIVNN